MPVFLTDFGLARLAETPRHGSGQAGSRYTRTGQALGTPEYMSPEQARGETGTLTPAADVWGLGCICYELLAGRRAFEAGSSADVVGRVLLGEPPALRAIRPDLPPGVGAVVRAALGKRARLRYPDAAALRALASGDTPEARLARGAVAAAENRWADARAALEGLPDWEAALQRGYLEALDPGGDRARAVREYGDGLARGLAFAWAFHNRGNARRDTGDPAGARRDLDAALALDPGHASAWYNRGRLRLEAGDPAGALADYRAALRIAPGFPEAHLAWLNLGDALRDAGDDRGAADAYAAHLRLRPEGPDAAHARRHLAACQARAAPR